MTNTGSWMARIINIGMIALLALLAIFCIGLTLLLGIAIVLPSAWPDGLQVFTTIPHATLPTKTLWARLVYCAQHGIMALLLTMVLVPLQRIVLSVSRRNPFTPGNVRCFHVIAAAFAIVTLAQVLLPVRFWLYSPFAETHDIRGVLMALLALIMAEVFREGVRLREDSELAV